MILEQRWTKEYFWTVEGFYRARSSDVMYEGFTMLEGFSDIFLSLKGL